jgi:predicted nucleic acid-binding protein
MALASEYRADYLVTSDDGLLEMSDVFASSTLDLPVPSVLTPQDFIQQIEPWEERRIHSTAGTIHPTSQ